MSADLAQLLQVLGRDPDERLSVNALNGQFTSTITTVAAAPDHVPYGDADCWYGTGVLHERVTAGRGTAADVTGIRELFADLDVKAGGVPSYVAAEAVAADLSAMLGSAPAAVVHSGHGLQPHWALERGAGTDWADESSSGHADAAALLRRWGRLVAHVAGQHGGHVDSVYDLSRVLRVPGTMNCKYRDAMVPVTVTFPGGAPVTIERLSEVLDEYAVPEYPEDRDTHGEAISPVAGWTWAADTHPAVQRAVKSWVKAAPPARHPWLLGVATSLAFARRTGMVSEAGHAEAVMAVTTRFRQLLATQPLVRTEGPGEIGHCWAHGVTVAQRKIEAAAVADWAFWVDLDADWSAPTTVIDGPTDDTFWDARPVLAHVKAFARARMCSPWGVLGVILVRVSTRAHPGIVLPPTVGSRMSLNLFVGLVGPSGIGKGASTSAARDALDVGELEVAHPGSGEGLAHLYAHREKATVVRDRSNVLLFAPEVDSLTALGSRQGATLMPQLRMAFSGESLGFAYVDKTKTLPIAEHTYRLGLVLGIQPGRAAPLLDDAVGGTPQRFLWMPNTDPGAPDDTPPEPVPWQWRDDTPGFRPGGLHEMTIPDAVRDTIRATRRAQLHGEDVGLDGHALLTRLKVAAAFAQLDNGRCDIHEEDWALAGTVMRVSDATRAGVVRHLQVRAEDANVARAKAEGQRAVVVSETLENAGVRKAGQTILRHLRTHGEMPWSEARRRVGYGLRQHFEAGVDALVSAGAVTVETSERGQLLRATEDTR